MLIILEEGESGWEGKRGERREYLRGKERGKEGEKEEGEGMGGGRKGGRKEKRSRLTPCPLPNSQTSFSCFIIVFSRLLIIILASNS